MISEITQLYTMPHVTHNGGCHTQKMTSHSSTTGAILPTQQSLNEDKMKLFIFDMNYHPQEIIKKLEATRCPLKGETISFLDDFSGQEIQEIIEAVGTKFQHNTEEIYIHIRRIYN